MKAKEPIYSVREFAKLAGVSTATVSRVFSGHDNVKPETKKRLTALAKQVGFRPNRASRASFGGRTHSVGVILCQLRTSFFADIAVGIQKVLLGENYLPILLDLRADTERSGICRLLDHRVDGLILSIADQTLKDNELAELVRFDVPIVMVDRNPSLSVYDSVSSDDFEGGCLAGEHLVALGHRRIAFYYPYEVNMVCRNRQEGLQKALRDVGQELTAKEGQTLVGTEADLIDILRQPDRPTAIFALNDSFAWKVYGIAGELGLRIPEDLSVIGYADLNFAETMQPGLTTIRQDGAAIGSKAAQMFLQRLNYMGNAPLETRHETLPVELIVRQSTASPTL